MVTTEPAAALEPDAFPGERSGPATTTSGAMGCANPRICPDEARAAAGFTISSAIGARTICNSGCSITPATKSAPNIRQIGRRPPCPRRRRRLLIAIGVCRKARFDSSKCRFTIDTKPPPASGECATGLPKFVRSQTTAFDNALESLSLPAQVRFEAFGQNSGVGFATLLVQVRGAGEESIWQGRRQIG